MSSTRFQQTDTAHIRTVVEESESQGAADLKARVSAADITRSAIPRQVRYLPLEIAVSFPCSPVDRNTVNSVISNMFQSKPYRSLTKTIHLHGYSIKPRTIIGNMLQTLNACRARVSRRYRHEASNQKYTPMSTALESAP
jgi:hypothetical protein